MPENTIRRQSAVTVQDYREASSAWLSTLTAEQQYSVYDYVYSGFRKLNQGLWDETKPGSAPLRDSLDAIFNEAPKAETVTVFRGTPHMPVFDTDETTKLHGFISCTADPSKVADFIRTEDGERVILEITAKDYIMPSAVNGNETMHEREFLLPRGRKYEIASIRRNCQWQGVYDGTDYSVTVPDVTVVHLIQL